MDQKNNIDKKVVSDFGKEWKAFNHQHIDESILDSAFDSYFHIFPFSDVKNAEGFDMGCGSGRWAKFVAPQVGLLHCIDPSEAALDEARVNMKNLQNCSFECAGVDNNILKNESQDFGYSLGVLHHIPDTSLALESCSKKLKSGAPFLLYLYYRFDNKSIISNDILKNYKILLENILTEIMDSNMSFVEKKLPKKNYV